MSQFVAVLIERARAIPGILTIDHDESVIRELRSLCAGYAVLADYSAEFRGPSTNYTSDWVIRVRAPLVHPIDWSPMEDA